MLTGTQQELSDLQGETVPGCHNTAWEEGAGVSAAGCVGCTAALRYIDIYISSPFFLVLFSPLCSSL